MKRGIRRAKTRNKIRARSKRFKRISIMGAPRDVETKPGKFAKVNTGFTHPHSSLKPYKKLANRRSRRKRRMAAKIGEEPRPEPRSSVKWDYW